MHHLVLLGMIFVSELLLQTYIAKLDCTPDALETPRRGRLQMTVPVTCDPW